MCAQKCRPFFVRHRRSACVPMLQCARGLPGPSRSPTHSPNARCGPGVAFRCTIAGARPRWPTCRASCLRSGTAAPTPACCGRRCWSESRWVDAQPARPSPWVPCCLCVMWRRVTRTSLCRLGRCRCRVRCGPRALKTRGGALPAPPVTGGERRSVWLPAAKGVRVCERDGGGGVAWPALSASACTCACTCPARQRPQDTTRTIGAWAKSPPPPPSKQTHLCTLPG